MTTADEAVHQLSRLKGKGYRIYYFMPDFSSTEAIWCKVFRDYLRTYGAEDKVALYLDLGQGGSPSELDELIELLSALGTQAPLVLVGESRNDVFRCILQQVDVLITTQDSILSCFVDYADANMEIVYGGASHSRIFNIQKEYDISIGVLTYQPDYEKLFVTLTSVIQQQGCRYEIVVGDDGSSNFEEQEIELWLLRHGFKDYTILRSSENKGIVHNVMNVLDAAQGRYVKLISPGYYLYSEHVLADMLRFMEEKSYKIAFGRACYYTKGDDKYYLVNRMNPFQLAPYQSGDFAAVEEAYLVYQDYVVGAAFIREPHILAAYTRDILGRIIYTEDAIYPIMIADDIRLGFWDQNFVWYECSDGISNDTTKEWRDRLLYDSNMTLTIIVERHSDILDLVFGPGDGMHRDDTAYMKRRAAYYAEAEKNLVAGAYLKNIDPLELKKLVNAEVVV